MSNIDRTEKVLSVENLKKYFYVGVGKNKLVVPAVDGISFDVYKREVLGLVGESGCGKTTTGRTIIKIYNPTDGKVTFNGVEIGSGYQSHLDNIKKIKSQLQNNIRELKPNGEKILEIEAKTNREILELEYKLEGLIAKHKNELKDLEKPLIDFKRAKYAAKNQYTLDIEEIEYDIKERRKALLDLTVNQAEQHYKREIAMAHHAYRRSVDGLKDSAALYKDEIKKRLEDLKTVHDNNISDIEEKYRDLIIENEAARKAKSDIKEELDELKLELKQRKDAEKTIFKTKLSEIKEPNKKEIIEAKLKLKIAHLEEKSNVKSEIAEIKSKTKKEISKLESEIVLTDEEKAILKQNIEELKVKSKEDILIEKQKIKESKLINKSEAAAEEVTKMQMIFQDPISSLNPRMTVGEIVAEGLIIQGKLSKEEIDEKVNKALELVGLSAEFAARYPHEFSGGQRQRIGVARALVMEPNLVIADEPVSALDVSIRAQVINLLTNLKEELGLTILFIAHDLSIIKFFCDRIAVMYYGKIVELATSEDLFKNPMHPYTISLLSAVPQPDPDYEKGRKRIFYNPRMHDYRFDKPTFREIGEGHFVYANDKEFEEMQKIYKK